MTMSVSISAIDSGARCEDCGVPATILVLDMEQVLTPGGHKVWRIAETHAFCQVHGRPAALKYLDSPGAPAAGRLHAVPPIDLKGGVQQP